MGDEVNTVAEQTKEELDTRAEEIQKNIDGIERKLSRNNLPPHKIPVLEYNLRKAKLAQRRTNEQIFTLSDLIRI